MEKKYFEIQERDLDGLTVYRLQRNDGAAFCDIVPAHGATVLQLALTKDDQPIQLINGYSTREELERNKASQNIHLAPFPNRIADGKYTFEGTDHQLAINKVNENNAIHGFIWNKEFKVVKKEEGKKVTQLELAYSYLGSEQGYPFPFAIHITYGLSDDGLIIKVKVQNGGLNNMPFGYGWHPYFDLRKQADDLELKLPSCQEIEVDERLIPTGEKEEYPSHKDFEKIGEKQFDTGFKITAEEKYHITKVRDPERDLTIGVWQDKGLMDYVQVYTPTDRKTLAIEPMTCPANAFNSGEGLLSLKPSETVQFSFGVFVDGVAGGW